VTTEPTLDDTGTARGVKRRSEPSYVAKLALGADADSRRWFPKTADDMVFMCLALAGEVGELANLIKKVARGTEKLGDAKTQYAVQMEVADIFTYLLDLSILLGVDLEKAYHHKRSLNEKRFGPKDDQ
jgi:NTP pyrophosphatase (non-canonical NTP hydrolase)